MRLDECRGVRKRKKKKVEFYYHKISIAYTLGTYVGSRKKTQGPFNGSSGTIGATLPGPCSVHTCMYVDNLSPYN